jgi:DNA-binding MarR family transcriptional regulator
MRLTPAGERVWEQVLEISAQVQDELLAPLAPRDRGRLVGYLRELDGNFAGR